MEPQLAMQLLGLHNTNVHAGFKNSPNQIKSQWVRYKRSTCLAGQDIADQLISCCTDPLRMEINSETGTNLNSMAEKDMLAAIQLMAVRKTIRWSIGTSYGTLSRAKMNISVTSYQG